MVTWGLRYGGFVSRIGSAKGLHADEETVGARAARLGGLVGTLHGASSLRFSAGYPLVFLRAAQSITLNTFRETQNYRSLFGFWQCPRQFSFPPAIGGRWNFHSIPALAGRRMKALRGLNMAHKAP